MCHQGFARIAKAIRRPARASGVLGPEQSTGLFSPCGFSPLMQVNTKNKTTARWTVALFWYTIISHIRTFVYPIFSR